MCQRDDRVGVAFVGGNVGPRRGVGATRELRKHSGCGSAPRMSIGLD